MGVDKNKAGHSLAFSNDHHSRELKHSNSNPHHAGGFPDLFAVDAKIAVQAADAVAFVKDQVKDNAVGTLKRLASKDSQELDRRKSLEPETSNDRPAAHHHAVVIKKGDFMKIIKPGSTHAAEIVTVLDPNWKGLVKVKSHKDNGGEEVRSYKREELAPAAIFERPNHNPEHRQGELGGFRRIGVPGGEEVDFKSPKAIFRWFGSSFRAAYRSTIFEVAVGVELLAWVWLEYRWYSGALDSLKEEDDDYFLAALQTYSEVWRGLQTFVWFLLTFFTGQVISRFFTRFNDMLACSHGMTGLVTYACTFMGDVRQYKYVEAVVRYSLALMHMHYLVLDGMMGEQDYIYLLRQELLTANEIAYLADKLDPIGTVQFWTYRTLNTAFEDPEKALHVVHQTQIMAKVENLRQSAARQVGYQQTSVPIHYFHLLSMTVFTFLCMRSYDMGGKLTWLRIQMDKSDDKVTWVNMAVQLFGDIVFTYIVSAMW